MSAAVLVESVQQVEMPAGRDAIRERELDLMVANIEGAAEGLAVFLLLATFGVAFVVALLTGVLT